jgi:YD repeat-containing protein
MSWTADEHLQTVTTGTSQTWYSYDSTGQRVRKYTIKGGLTEERLYLGGFEIYRKRQGATITLERETLHLMDGNRRIALVETKTVDTSTTLPLPSTVTRYQLDNPTATPATARQNLAPRSAKSATGTRAKRRTKRAGCTTTERATTRRGWAGGQRRIRAEWWMERVCMRTCGIIRRD